MGGYEWYWDLYCDMWKVLWYICVSGIVVDFRVESLVFLKKRMNLYVSYG